MVHRDRRDRRRHLQQRGRSHGFHVDSLFFEPEVVAVFTGPDGDEAYRVAMTRHANQIPTEADEGDLELSYNAVIAGEIIVPGVETRGCPGIGCGTDYYHGVVAHHGGSLEVEGSDPVG